MVDKVNLEHPEYAENKDIWEKCRDAISGEEAIKAKGTRYLPQPTGQDNADYKRYLQRAKYYNATQRIKNSIIGQIFRKKPIFTPNDKFDLSSISNTGQDFNQFAKDILGEIVEVGRVGVLVDYSNQNGKPYFVKYQAENIINWKFDYIDGQQVTKLVVLKEFELDTNYDFAHKYIERYRVLSLKDGIYVQNIYTKNENNTFEPGEDFFPVINGQKFGYIPFYVTGSKGVGLDVIKPILKDVVNINIGHYINSADYENDLHWSGVKTPCFPGWRPEEDGPIPIGKPMGTPAGSQPHMLESSSDSGLKEEMTRKEERMATLGSQIIAQQGRYLQSAETSGNQKYSETSILSSLSDDLDSFFELIFFDYLAWLGYNDEYNISFNKDFDPGEVDMNSIVQLSALNDNRKISYKTFYNYLKKHELVPKDKTIEMEFEEIQAEDQAMNNNL